MNILIEILQTLPVVAISLFLILKPLPFMNFIGNIYWQLAKFTAIGKSKETKKYFIGENPFWFKIIGTVMLIISCFSILARIGEHLPK